MTIEELVLRIATSTKWILRHGMALRYLKPLAEQGDAHARLWFDEHSRQDLRALQDELRTSGPISKGRGGCVVTAHSTARQIYGKPGRYRHMQATDAMPKIMATIYRWTGRNSYSDPFEAPSIVALEGAELGTARGLLRARLSRRAVAELRPEIERCAHLLCKDLTTVAGDRAVDLVEHYGRRFSQQILALLFDVEPTAVADACERAERMNRLIDLGLQREGFAALIADARVVDQWADRRIDDIATTPHSVIAPAVEAMKAGRLELEQVRRMISLLLVAGYTTTISVLMTGIKLLIEHPDQLALLRRQPELWGNATEEILRLADPVMVIPRWTTESSELDGICLRESRPLYLSGVNADPVQFEDPHRFDIRRANASTHFAFGGGAHLCLGATLARAEIETALRAFFSHFDRPALVDAVPGNSATVRTWDRLLVALEGTRP